MSNRAERTQTDNPKATIARDSNGVAFQSVLENPLSERQMDVAKLLVTGASNNEIAEALVISPHTVKVHLRNIYEKLGVNSRTEASLLLIQHGWVQLPGVKAAGTAPEIPQAQPDPLPDTVGSLFAWQRTYLLVALLAALASFLLPGVLNSRQQSSQSLWSDGPLATQAAQVIPEEMTPHWKFRTPLIPPRDRFPLVLFKNASLFAIGGETLYGQVLNTVEEYKLEVNEWREVSPLPLPLANAAATVFDEAIYVAGGTTVSYTVTNDLWRYQPLTNSKWQAGGHLPVSLAGAQLLADESGLYLLGGGDGTRMRDEVWHVRPTSGSAILAQEWRLMTRLPSPRAFFGAQLVDNNLYIVGGQDNDGERADAHVYDFASEQWKPLRSLSSARYGLTLLYDGRSLLAIGGGKDPAILERYDINSTLWSNIPVPVSGAWRHLGAAANEQGKLFLVGGWSEGYLAVHLHYTSRFNIYLPLTLMDDTSNSSEE